MSTDRRYARHFGLRERLFALLQPSDFGHLTFGLFRAFSTLIFTLTSHALATKRVVLDASRQEKPV